MYGNPHKRESFLGPLNNRGMGRQKREKPVYKPGPYLDGQETIYKSLPFPRGQETIYRPLTAGYDGGNRRPIYDRNGNLVPQRPVLRDSGSSTVPVPIMDYTGNRTAMNKGLDNWGGNLGGTFDQDGYGDPSSVNQWGYDYEPEYNYDHYDDNIYLDPGLQGHASGPLYFG